MRSIHRLAGVCLFAGMTLATTILAAADVAIENRGKRVFYYSLRDGRDGSWSDSLELLPNQTRAHRVSRSLQISYLTGEAHFEWLDAGRTYRILDVARGRLRPVTEVRCALSDLRRATATRPEVSAANPGSRSPAPANRRPAVGEDGLGKTPASERSAAAGTRTIRVAALADIAYRETVRDWRERIRRVVAGASEYYEREFGIRLVVEELRAWEYRAVTDTLDARWERLMRESPEGVDLIVAFAGFGDYVVTPTDGGYAGQLGRAAFFGQHLLISDRLDVHENRPKTVLIHELGHIFGAFHVANRNLVMYPGYLELPTEDIIAGKVRFGDALRGLLQLTRDFDFRHGVTGLSPALRQRIQVLYRQHGLEGEIARTDPITQGFEYLSDRARLRAERMNHHAEQSRLAFDETPN